MQHNIKRVEKILNMDIIIYTRKNKNRCSHIRRVIYLYFTDNYKKFKNHLLETADDYVDIETDKIYSVKEIIGQVKQDDFISSIFDYCANIYIILTKNNIRRFEIF